MAPENEAKYYIDDVEHNVSDIDAFYDYLVEEAKQKQQAKNKDKAI